MIDNILTVGNYVLILFVLIGVGFVCNKVNLLSGRTIKDMTNFVLYIVTPCVIINSYQREFDRKMLWGLIITVVASVAAHLFNVLLAHLAVRDKDKRRERSLRFGTVFSNCGYMSLPLQSVLLGEDGVFYGTAYVMVFQIILWTYGVLAMSGDVRKISLKNIIFNPGVTSSVIGVFLFLLSFKLPSIIGEPVKHLAALNTPVPMIIVGYHLANASLKLRGISPYITILLRHIVSPLAVLLGLFLCGISGPIMVSCVIAAASPIAAATTMFSEKFDADIALSATAVSISTLLAIITMPVIVGIATAI